MTRIYVIDNGGQWTHREWRTLRDLEVETKIVANTTPYDVLEKEEVDGLVLSGGAPRIGLDGDLGEVTTYLKKAAFPMLGICAGHQFMARFYGGTVAPSKTPEFGKITLQRLKEDPLFEQVPKKSIVWESHHDEISKLPSEFIHLAKSDNCEIQAIRHATKPLYGLQFHPEVEHTEHGEQIFQNFIALCKQGEGRGEK